MVKGKKKKNIIVVLLTVLFVLTCHNYASANSNTSSVEMEWEIIMNGLPAEEELQITGSFAKNGVPYLSNKNKLYRWSETDKTWQPLIEMGGYGYATTFISGNGTIYSMQSAHRFMYKLDETENKWVRMENLPVEGNNGLEVVTPTANGFVSATRKDADNPVIWQYDETSDTFTNLNFPYTNLDGKPHRSLMEDSKGRIWYRSNYSGLFLYENDSWTKVHDRSPAIGMAEDGTVYISYELQPTTQLQTFFKYTEDGRWQMIAQSRGYGTSPVSVGYEDYVAAIGGRFQSLIVGDGRSINLPHSAEDIVERISVRDRRTYVTDGVIYTTQSYDAIIDGENVRHQRVLRLKIGDVGQIRPYNSNLELHGAGYIGDGELNKAVDIQYLNKDNAILAVNSPNNGKLILLNTSTLKSTDIYKTNRPILAMEVLASTDKVIVATADGLTEYIIAKGGVKEVWNKQIELSKAALTSNVNGDGSIALLSNNSDVSVYNSERNQVVKRSFRRSYINDIALNGDLFYIVGFDNKRLPGGNPVQVAFLTAFDYTKEKQVFSKFGFDGKNLANNIADTRLYKVNFGEDGRLYILGESAGSETIFRYDGDHYEGKVILSNIDHYNDLWNTKSAHIAYYAALEPETGKIESSQLTMSRLTSGLSNTFRVKDIASDDLGNTYIVGVATAHIAAREAQSINGINIGTYAGADPTYLALNSNFSQRYNWTTFTKELGKGAVKAIANKGGQRILIGTTEGEGEWFTTGNIGETTNQYPEGNIWVAIINDKENKDSFQERIANHWGHSYIEAMAERNVLVENDKESFNPDKDVTRGEFIEYVARSLELYNDEASTAMAYDFSDINQVTKESQVRAIAIMREQGLLEGYEDNTVRPYLQISRQEAMTFYVRAMEELEMPVETEKSLAEYKDSSSISEWAIPYVKKSVGSGLFKGTSQNTLSPQANLTHAESLTALFRLVE